MTPHEPSREIHIPIYVNRKRHVIRALTVLGREIVELGDGVRGYEAYLVRRDRTGKRVTTPVGYGERIRLRKLDRFYVIPAGIFGLYGPQEAP